MCSCANHVISAAILERCAMEAGAPSARRRGGKSWAAPRKSCGRSEPSGSEPTGRTYRVVLRSSYVHSVSTSSQPLRRSRSRSRRPAPNRSSRRLALASRCPPVQSRSYGHEHAEPVHADPHTFWFSCGSLLRQGPPSNNSYRTIAAAEPLPRRFA